MKKNKTNQKNKQNKETYHILVSSSQHFSPYRQEEIVFSSWKGNSAFRGPQMYIILTH